jgi:beta-lactamase regulating signal transducer with metallopeptidase domain
MTLIWESAVRSAVLIVLAAAALRAFRVQDAPVKHACWSMILAAAMLMPGLMAVLPPLEIELPEIAAPAPAAAAIRAVQPAAIAGTVARRIVPRPESTPIPANGLDRQSWQSAASAIWMGVALGLLLRFAAGLWAAARLVRRSRSVEGLEGVRESEDLAVPAAIGGTVLLPARWTEWPPAKLDAVLAHEREHVRRGDFYIHAAAAFHRAIFWFNPLAWWLKAQLSDLAEQACDDSALRVADRTEYAQYLLSFVRARRPRFEGVAMARGVRTERRVDRILEAGRQLSKPLTARSAVVLASLALPLLLCTAAAQPARPTATPPVAPPARPAPLPPPAREALPPPPPSPAPLPPGEDNFILLDGSRIVMSGSELDSELAQRLRETLKKDLVWFRRDGKSYLVTDPAAVADFVKLWREDENVLRVQQDVERRQEQVEAELALLERQRENVRIPVGNLSQMIAQLKAELDRVRTLSSGQVEQLQEKLAMAMEELSRARDLKLSETNRNWEEAMRKLQVELDRNSQEHERLAERMERRSEEATEAMRKLIERVLKNGTARPY